ncbi:MAG: MAPEG family protein [Gammaproteobacteria bacterium]
MSGSTANLFILCVCLLSLKMLFLGVQTARARGTAKRFVNSEDTAWLGGETVAADIDTAARWRRAHLNDVENFVVFVALGASFIALGGHAAAGAVYFGLFTLARFGHGFAYLAGRARMRRDAYATGMMVLAAMAVHTAVLAIDGF